MKKELLAFSVLALPVIVSAEVDTSPVTDLITGAKTIIDALIPVVFAVALLYFFFGLAKFVMSSGEDKEKGKNIMIWGIVALFIMSSVWGIIAFLGSTFGLDNSAAPGLPDVTSLETGSVTS